MGLVNFIMSLNAATAATPNPPSGDDGLWHDDQYFSGDDGLWHDDSYFSGDDGLWHDEPYF